MRNQRLRILSPALSSCPSPVSAAICLRDRSLRSAKLLTASLRCGRLRLARLLRDATFISQISLSAIFFALNCNSQNCASRRRCAGHRLANFTDKVNNQTPRAARTGSNKLHHGNFGKRFRFGTNTLSSNCCIQSFYLMSKSSRVRPSSTAFRLLPACTAPTPCGVPVYIRSPVRSVINCDT